MRDRDHPFTTPIMCMPPPRGSGPSAASMYSTLSHAQTSLLAYIEESAPIDGDGSAIFMLGDAARATGYDPNRIGAEVRTLDRMGLVHALVLILGSSGKRRSWAVVRPCTAAPITDLDDAARRVRVASSLRRRLERAA